MCDAGNKEIIVGCSENNTPLVSLSVRTIYSLKSNRYQYFDNIFIEIDV